MGDWTSLILDALLILVVASGTVQASRLIIQLRDLRASRVEMERFVRDFNSAVIRAEAGIKSLRAAARESGDDLEKLVEKAVMVRDELNFIVESADGVAERLSVKASGVLHADKAAQAAQEPPRQAPPAEKRVANQPSPKTGGSAAPAEPAVASRAEQELLQALKKLS